MKKWVFQGELHKPYDTVFMRAVVERELFSQYPPADRTSDAAIAYGRTFAAGVLDAFLRLISNNSRNAKNEDGVAYTNTIPGEDVLSALSNVDVFLTDEEKRAIILLRNVQHIADLFYKSALNCMTAFPPALVFTLSDLNLEGESFHDIFYLAGKNVRFDKTNFTRALIMNSDLSQMCFYGADFSEATLDSCSLENALLDRTLFRSARLFDVRASEATWANSDFSNARIQRANMSRIDGTYSQFTNAQLANVDLHSSQLDGADLRGAQCDNVNFFGSQFSGSRWGESDKGSSTHLTNCILTDLETKRGQPCQVVGTMTWDRVRYENPTEKQRHYYPLTGRVSPIVSSNLRRTIYLQHFVSATTGARLFFLR